MTPDKFIASLAPAAQASQKITNIPASFVIAQGALESGWGKSSLALWAYNLFGVKADNGWHGDVISMPTKEFINGKFITQNAIWRKYDGWQSCIDDHAQFFIKNPRYSDAFKTTTPYDFARAIADAGYATDPDYAKKINSTISAHNLTQYD